MSEVPDRVVLDAGWEVAESIGEDWRWRELQLCDRGTRAGAFASPRWVPASVPGSVTFDLLKLGEIRDPYRDLHSREAEWVAARRWVYRRELEVPRGWSGGRLWLCLDGLDPGGEVLLDGELVGEHRSIFAPFRVELSGRVRPGDRHRLVIALFDAPPGEPQLGRTSRVSTHRPRLGHWWDFSARLLDVGIWGEVRLERTGPARIEDVWVRARPGEDLRLARIDVVVALERTEADAEVAVELLDPAGAVVASARAPAGEPLSFELSDPELWWPNGLGAQPLYRCRARAVVGSEPSDERETVFGIRSLELAPNPWPPPGVEPAGEPPLPYTFAVNGRPFFARGWNWVPADLMHNRGDLNERVRDLLELARDSGANLIRVNGVGLLEREPFYRACDELGLLVWQEFALTSAGIDSTPAADPAYLDLLEREAEEVVPGRRNHPSLALWCGGNELTDAGKRPLTAAHPAAARLAYAVERLDPDRPFLPTSPSGPVYGLDDEAPLARPAELHDVHGPWHDRGPVETPRPFQRSTALFHSEFGVQGATSLRAQRRFLSPELLWPPDDTNPAWVHHGSWWLHRHRVQETFGPVEDPDEYWRLSQFLQADRLRAGIEANRRRWPACSGSLVWQLNEPWPNAHCTSVVEHHGRPKLAYQWASRAFAPVAASLCHDPDAALEGTLRASLHLAADRPFDGRVRATLLDLDGCRLLEYERPARGEGILAAGDLAWTAERAAVVLVRLEVLEGDARVHDNPYLIGLGPRPMLAPARGRAPARLGAAREGEELVLTNRGPGLALFPTVELMDSSYRLRASDDTPVLAPGETARIRLSLRRRETADTDQPNGRPAAARPRVIRISGWNLPTTELVWEA